ncbi:MAG: glycosyltransferase family 4 protein [Oscillospiraceae bacterium]|nr:glycosyltransferase family 4 protein [Oscillospiraceae bacterium]
MVYELVKCMNNQAFDVQVVCLNPPKGTTLESAVEKICPVRYLHETGRVSVKTVRNVVKALDEINPDVIHAHLSGAALAPFWTILRRKKLVITAHTKPEKAFPGLTEKLVRCAICFGKTKLVAVSEENTTMSRAYFGLDKEKCVCVNNGIDLDRFSRKPHDGFTLIHVGRQDENKNQAALIRCFARLHEKHPNTKLLLLGDGPLHEKLVAQVTELGLTDTVILTGNIPNTEDYYAVSDLYVQCSHREAMPLSVLEAMAAGMPIVSTDVGGLSDVVQDNGILVPDNNEDALYDAIEKIYEQSEEETAKMCAASGRIVENYSSKAMARAYENIYSEMCK